MSASEYATQRLCLQIAGKNKKGLQLINNSNNKIYSSILETSRDYKMNVTAQCSDNTIYNEIVSSHLSRLFPERVIGALVKFAWGEREREGAILNFL